MKKFAGGEVPKIDDLLSRTLYVKKLREKIAALGIELEHCHEDNRRLSELLHKAKEEAASWAALADEAVAFAEMTLIESLQRSFSQEEKGETDG